MSNEGKSAGDSGVGGWLKVLVIFLMWLGPLFTVAMVGQLYFLQGRVPGFGLTPFTVAGDLFFLALGYFSFSAGKGLNERKPGAVQIAKLYFQLTMIGCAVAAAYIGKLLYFSEIGKLAGFHLLQLAIYPVIYSVIWYSYLSSSVRVRNTYD